MTREFIAQRHQNVAIYERYRCVLILKMLQFEMLRLEVLKERGQCDLRTCMPKRSMSGCDLWFRAAFWRLPREGDCDCIANALRYCVCVSTATKINSQGVCTAWLRRERERERDTLGERERA